jgi:hypothetical protein
MEKRGYWIYILSVFVVVFILSLLILFGFNEKKDNELNNDEKVVVREQESEKEKYLPEKEILMANDEIYEEYNNNACQNLDCPIPTYVAALKATDVFYECECEILKKAEKSEIICFSSIEQANSYGYIREDC